MRSAPATLDPADGADAGSPARHNLARLMFDTLVTLSDSGKPQPALALSWQNQSSGQRWQFLLRPGVKFDDGTPLTSDLVASSLRAANPGWKIYSANDSVAVELESPNLALPGELALARNCVVKRDSGSIHGTGPFQVKEWQQGRKLVLAATEDYWGGRPYLDSIQVDMGASPRDQMLSLELGKADLVEILSEQARHASIEGRRISTSGSVELMALVFTRDRQSTDEERLRAALALCIDRASIKNVLMQGEGDPAGGILPRWLSGYEFLFSNETDLPKARQEIAQAHSRPAWTLGYDSADPLTRLVAERIILNARDAGISLQLVTGNADVRLARIMLPSVNPGVALAGAAKVTGLPLPKLASDDPENLYRSESALLRTGRIIPLFHLPVNYGLSIAVRNWVQHQDGTWDLGDVWLASETP
jgi:peptide/nickel transport system substrate-binding protein